MPVPSRDEKGSEEDSEIEQKTRELMQNALKGSDSETMGQLESSKPAEQTGSEVSDSISSTYERIELRMNDILSSIEDSLGSTENAVQKEAYAAIERILKKLQDAGLGVFTNLAVSIVKKELNESLSPETSLHHVYQAVEESRKEIHDILSKASRGSTKVLQSNVGGLRTKLVKAHALLNEREHELETARAENSKLRTEINELNETKEQKEQKLVDLAEEIAKLERDKERLYTTIKEKDEDYSVISGQLAQAQSEVEQQQDLIAKLDSAEELVVEYEKSAEEISRLQGEVSSLEERVAQQQSAIEHLQSEKTELESETSDFRGKVEDLESQLAKTRSEYKTTLSALEFARSRTSELEARWDVLVQIAEDEPTFQAYFIIADKSQWFPLSHLSSALGIPTVRLKGQLQKFVNAGLVEIEGEKIRPVQLSKITKDGAEKDKRANESEGAERLHSRVSEIDENESQ
jgi:chromosome segregation ATPase